MSVNIRPASRPSRRLQGARRGAAASWSRARGAAGEAAARAKRVGRALERNAGAVFDATSVGSSKVLRALAGPALRGFLLQRGKQGDETLIDVAGDACFTHAYERDDEELAALYGTAK